MEADGRRETLPVPHVRTRMRSFSTVDLAEESAFTKSKRDRDAEMAEGVQFLLDIGVMRDTGSDFSKIGRMIGLDDSDKNKGFQKKEADSRLEQSRQYVPKFVVDYFAKRRRRITQAHEESFNAAMMFVDVSGFTKLTEKLSQNAAKSSASSFLSSVKDKGKDHDDDKQTMERGAEQLVEHLNKYFDNIINIIDRWGGDIIKFAGDAMLCTFYAKTGEDDRARIQQALIQACCCSEDLHAIDPTVRSVDSVQLKLHIGIGAGTARFVFVGGNFDRWEYLVADIGKPPGPIKQFGEAEPLAEPDETVVHKAAFEYISDLFTKAVPVKKDNKTHVGFKVERLKKRPDSSINFTIPEQTLEEEEVYLIENFVPAAIKGRLDTPGAGSSKWMCDLRRVTILFINIKGLNTNLPDYLSKLQMSMEVIQSCLYAEEGSVNKYISDDKGTTLIAGFGLPPLSHRDDPLRGVRAAIRIMQRLVEESEEAAAADDAATHKNIFSSSKGALLPSIGITTGNCFCGIVGGARRKEYTMMGDVVNLAARLMQAASGDVIVDKNTYDESVKEINYDIRPAIKVKGKSAPIPIFSPDPERNTTASLSLVRERRRTEFVGRETFIQQFVNEVLEPHLQNWDRSNQRWNQTPEGKVVHITGEVGIGKSRLTDQFVNIAAGDEKNKGLVIALGEGKENDKYCFNAWVPVMLNLLSLLEDLLSEKEDAVGDLPGKAAPPKVKVKKTVSIKRSESEQWQEFHQQRLSAHDRKNGPEKPSRQERCNIVRGQSVRYQRVRGAVGPRVRKDFPVDSVPAVKEMLLKEIAKDDEELQQAVPLFLEVLQFTQNARSERGPQVIVGPKVNRAQREEELEKMTPEQRQQELDKEASARADRLQKRKSVINLMQGIIAKVNQHTPIMLVLEDANFMDDESWDLTASLCRAKLPFLLCLVENVHRRDKWREKLLEHFYKDITCDPARVFHVNTPKMTEAEIVNLAKAHWDTPNVPMEVLEMLVRRSEGNPLFCERLMDTLMARQIIKVRNDSTNKPHVMLLEKDLLFGVRIDPGLMTMIRANLDKQSAALQRTLKLASIIASCNLMLSTPIFTVHLLSFMDSAYKRKPEQTQATEELQKRLNLLEHQQQLIERVDISATLPSMSSSDDCTAYRFRSSLFRDVVYRSLPFAERQHLHAILARSIAMQLTRAQQIDDPAIRALVEKHWKKWNELIAEHYSLSGDEKEAFVHCMLVGEHNLQTNKDKKAAEFLEKALGSFSRVDESIWRTANCSPRVVGFMGASCHYLLALACFRLGRVDDAKRSMEAALRHLEHTIPDSTFAVYKMTVSKRFTKTIRKKTTGSNRASGTAPVIKTLSSNEVTFVVTDTGAHKGLRRMGSELVASNWLNLTSDTHINDSEFDKLLAKVYTWLAVVYFASNDKPHGDWASANAIALFQHSMHMTEADMGLVSLAYAHACINSQQRGQNSRATGYQTKALHFFRKLTDDSHTHARVEVLASIAEFDAGCGRWDDAIHKYKQCVRMSRDIGDLRVWERCMSQLGHIFLLSGQPMDATQLFVAVCQSSKGATDRAQIEQHALHGLAQCFLALGMPEAADEMLSFLHVSGFDTTRVKSLWLMGRYERSLLEAQRVLIRVQAPFTNLWTQYWTIVNLLDVLILQWARILAHVYDLTEANASNNPPTADRSSSSPVAQRLTSQPSASEPPPTMPTVTSASTTTLNRSSAEERQKSTFLGLSEVAGQNGRRSSGGRPSKVLIDDLHSIRSIERVKDRIPSIRSSVVQLLVSLHELSKKHPFAAHTHRVYKSMSDILKGKPQAKVLPNLAKVLTQAAVAGHSALPREKCLALWFHMTLLGENSDSELEGLKTQISAMWDSQIMPEVLTPQLVRILEGTPVLRNVSRATPEGVGKVLDKLSSKLIGEFSARVQAIYNITYEDIDELEPEPSMEIAESYLLNESTRGEFVSKAAKGENTVLVRPDFMRTIKIILKTQQFKSWQFDSQAADDVDEV